MKVMTINMGNDGSTGVIIKNITKHVTESGGLAINAFPQGSTDLPLDENDYIICSLFNRLVTRELTYITGLEGCLSVISTIKLIKKIKEFGPDIIHLNNLHGWYLNFPILFSFLKKSNIHIVWTLHDCWSFTGHCPHFQKSKCDKWKTRCCQCSQYKDYPKCYFDNSGFEFWLKKKCFLGFQKDKVTIVAPSKWLKELVDQSFLNVYDAVVIHNGIDLNVFKPCESLFRQRFDLTDKFVLLGVASSWGYEKGLDVFIELSERLPEKYRIILVGVTKEQGIKFNDKIIGIQRTNDQHELAEIYSSANVFVNPTRQDTFPTVNMEALACGTPVITFDTCGSPEIPDASSGRVIEKDNLELLINQIIEICEKDIVDPKNCVERATMFGKTIMLDKYLEIYKK